MSERGRILVASDSGTFLLRFVGDVRLTLCVAIDDYLQQMFCDPDFEAVVVDLSEAQGLDSTSLGLLVKLAQETLRQTGKEALLLTKDGDVHGALQSVGVDELFEITSAVTSSVVASSAVVKEVNSSPLECASDDLKEERAIRKRVLEAHQRLMALNEANAAAFKDLVAQLEALGS